jgi:hypothetical protein
MFFTLARKDLSKIAARERLVDEISSQSGFNAETQRKLKFVFLSLRLCVEFILGREKTWLFRAEMNRAF